MYKQVKIKMNMFYSKKRKTKRERERKKRFFACNTNFPNSCLVEILIIKLKGILHKSASYNLVNVCVFEREHRLCYCGVDPKCHHPLDI